MKKDGLALSDVSGLMVSLLDCLTGKKAAEWQESLTKFLRKENPFPIKLTIGDTLYQTDTQKNGGEVTLRELLFETLMPYADSGRIDLYRSHPEVLPPSWAVADIRIYFRETIARYPMGQKVGCLTYVGGQWYKDYGDLDCQVGAWAFVAIPQAR
jgi:hypothetical protein